jgi:glycosyltransferase involved in cell wall biosynthesis
MSIAVLLPCYNESATIVQTISGFRSSLPNAKIYVCDNGSTDDTATLARCAGCLQKWMLKFM